MKRTPNNHNLSRALSQLVFEALPRSKGSISPDLGETLYRYSVSDLLEILPEGFFIEKNIVACKVWYKIKYPKIGCSMCHAGHDLAIVLVDMIMLLDRNGYMRKYKCSGQ